MLRFELMNVKCGGCGNSIRKTVTAVEGVGEVNLDVDSGRLEVDAADSLRDEIAARLARLGYPERGSVEGVAALAAGARSFVSCAVGRFGDSGKD